MSLNIFFSWQSDTATEFNKNFVLDALDKAKKILKNEEKTVTFSDTVIDRDTQNVSGTPSLPQTIEEKIKACQILVADVSVINRNTWLQRMLTPKVFPLAYNPNVMVERGKIDRSGLITVFNESFHPLNEEALPFDIVQDRWPIRYKYSSKLKHKKKEILEKLARELADAIKLIVSDGIKNPRLRYYPFLEWDQWAGELQENLKIDYESNDFINATLGSIVKNTAKEREVVRVVGLSGLGKTRLVYEAFNPVRQAKNLDIAKNVLYVDLNSVSDFNEQLTLLSESHLRKIIIFDNCDRKTLALIAPLIKKTSSKLSAIAIDHNVGASILDRDAEFLELKVEQDNFQSVIDNILLKYFPDPGDDDQRKLIKQFANGHTLIATLLARDKIAKDKEWRPIITGANVMDKILGDSGRNSDERKVLRAVSVFERLGHYEDLAPQTEFVADSVLLTDLASNTKNNTFREVCSRYIAKGIMERQARYLIIRTKPIALSLAVEWWEHCPSEKAKQLFESLNSQSELRVSLTDQLRYLDFLGNARLIVENFVKPTGPFGTAEVLDTEEGSRLFRAFVEVNPQATSLALERLFQNQSTDYLLSIERGRRNLIWALEKLCFHADVFERSAKVLLNFAVAENEEITNNATGQFLQLFQAFLPGTQADYNARISMIQYALGRGEAFRRLGFKALMRGLRTRDFYRGGGAEEQGSRSPLRDYPRTNAEAEKVNEYWKYCIQELTAFAVSNSEFSATAREALINSIRSFCSVEAAGMILPTIETLLNHSSDGWLDIKSNLKLALNFEKYSISEADTETISKLLERLNPQDFESLYTQYVKSPRVDHQEETFEGVRQKAKEFGRSFASENYDSKYLPLFYSGEQQNGLPFAEGLAIGLDETNVESFFNDSIKVLLGLPKDSINLIVLAGFFRSLENGDTKSALLRRFLNDATFQHFTFQVASIAKPTGSIFIELVKDIVAGKFPVSEFQRFEYGRPLDHLESSEIIQGCKLIADYTMEGKKVVLGVIFMYNYNDDKRWHETRDFVRELLFSKGLLESSDGVDLEKHKWNEFCIRLLKEGDEGFANHLMNEVIGLCHSDTYVSSVDFELKSVLVHLMEQYFSVVWPVLSNALLEAEKDSWTYHNLRVLLRSRINSYGKDKGVLFFGDLEQIYRWCSNNAPLAPNRIASMTPIFDINPIANWHPFTRRLIDDFGDNDDFIDNLDANMNSYSWTGSLVPLLRDKKKIIDDLKDHKFEKIRLWSQKVSLFLDTQIGKESNQDVERLL